MKHIFQVATLILSSSMLAPAAHAQSDKAPRFIELEESLGARDYSNPKDLHNRWNKIKDSLVDGFNNICGDTFCEGDYSNLTSIEFTCSVETANQQIKQCVWLFAGNYPFEVNPNTGAVTTGSKLMKECKINIPMKVSDAIDYLEKANNGKTRETAFEVALPNGVESIYDQLTECGL